jgi:peroxiredoxin
MRRSDSRWKRRAAEALLFIALLAGNYAWQSRDMLPVSQRQPAPHFELVDLDGNTWTTDTLRGKPAVVYFFAPWCRVCSASAPQLRWFQRWTDGSVQLVLIGLDWDNSDELDAYAQRHRLQLPVLVGTQDTGAAYRVRGYPAYYVIDSDGRIAARDFGFTTAAGLWFRTLFM